MAGHGIYLALTLVGVVLIVRRLTSGPRTVVLVVSVAVLGFARFELPSPHCIVEGAFSTSSLAFLKSSMLLKLGIVFLPTLFFGRVFCGYVCPKGALQEILFRRRLRITPPRRLDSILRYVPYLSLGALAYFPLAHDYRLWTDLDPFLWTFQLHGHVPGLVLLVALLPASVVLLRPFCRYLCPLVPIFRILSLRPPLGRAVVGERCTGCTSGKKACSFDAVSLGSSPKRCVHHRTECLACGQCREACPKDAIS